MTIVNPRRRRKCDDDLELIRTRSVYQDHLCVATLHNDAPLTSIELKGGTSRPTPWDAHGRDDTHRLQLLAYDTVYTKHKKNTNYSIQFHLLIRDENTTLIDRIANENSHVSTRETRRERIFPPCVCISAFFFLNIFSQFSLLFFRKLRSIWLWPNSCASVQGGAFDIRLKGYTKKNASVLW